MSPSPISKGRHAMRQAGFAFATQPAALPAAYPPIRLAKTAIRCLGIYFNGLKAETASIRDVR